MKWSEMDTHSYAKMHVHINRVSTRVLCNYVDQALFYKIMELRWSIPEYGEKLVMRLGGLHISMNSLKVIGQHMKCSGLVEVWVESGILGPDSADNVMTGKSYNRGMIVQKLTFQATWKIVNPQFCTLLESDDMCSDLAQVANDNDVIPNLVDQLMDPLFQRAKHAFSDTNDEDINFQYCWKCLEMVMILLFFTRSLRDGDWDFAPQCIPKNGVLLPQL